MLSANFFDELAPVIQGLAYKRAEQHPYMGHEDLRQEGMLAAWRAYEAHRARLTGEDLRRVCITAAKREMIDVQRDSRRPTDAHTVPVDEPPDGEADYDLEGEIYTVQIARAVDQTLRRAERPELRELFHELLRPSKAMLAAFRARYGHGARSWEEAVASASALRFRVPYSVVRRQLLAIQALVRAHLRHSERYINRESTNPQEEAIMGDAFLESLLADPDEPAAAPQEAGEKADKPPKAPKAAKVKADKPPKPPKKAAAPAPEAEAEPKMRVVKPAKTEAKPKAEKAEKAEKAPRTPRPLPEKSPCLAGSKQAIMLDLLKRKSGATMEELLAALAPWKEVTVRSGFGWDMFNKGYRVLSRDRKDGTKVYYIEGETLAHRTRGPAPKPAKAEAKPKAGVKKNEAKAEKPAKPKAKKAKAAPVAEAAAS